MSSRDGTVYDNSDLFNDRYLEKELPRRAEWFCDDEAQDTFEELQELYEDEYETVQNYGDNEDDTIDDWIQPVLDALGYDHLGETGILSRNGSVDIVLFDSTEARQASVEPRNDDDYDTVYQNAVSILEAKSWDTDFSKKFSEERNYFDASQQINFYLSNMPLNTVEWGILTDGRQWRIYGPYDHQSYVYYQIDDLPQLISEGDLTEFKYFYTLFRPEAFKRRDGGCFLDTIYKESEATAINIGDDLQDNVFNALAILAEGFISTNELDLRDDEIFDPDSLNIEIPTEEEFTLEDLRKKSLIYLYRLMFLFYAESDGLLQPVSDSNVRTYNAELSLVSLRDQIVEYGDSPEDVAETYLEDINTQWDRLDTFFRYIDKGQEDVGIQAYDGGLFDRSEHLFLNNHTVSNHYLAQVIYLLSTTKTDDGYEPVDYGELQIRHLGSIYEGLLQHRLQVAPADMVAVREDDEEEWVLEEEFDEDNDDGTIVDQVSEGSLYLTTDDNERKITGSFYTPKYIVDDIIEWAIEPKIEEIEDELEDEDLLPGTTEYAREFRSRVLDLNILDPAMGSGHFLTRTTSYLAREVIERIREADELVAIAIEGETGTTGAFTDGGLAEADSHSSEHEDDTAPVSKFEERQVRRDIAKECIFGVDRNPVAVELAKLSMWLETLAADQPLAFLDHHLKQGDSLLGSDIEKIDGIDEVKPDDEQTTLPTTVPDRREEVIQTLVSVFGDLIDIPNETIEEAREMKRIYYSEVQENTQYQRFKQLANVDIANELGLDWNRASAFDRSGIQSDAFHYMANYLESDEHWYGEGVDEAGIIKKPWFQSAQEYSEEFSFFHWKLEFPEVYYDIDAHKREDAGFDAIIGNPPWLGTRTGSIDDRASDYYGREYDVEGQSDLAEVFIKRCIELGEDIGSIGMVIPKRLATNEEFENFRQSIAVEETLNYAIDYGVAFEGVNNDAMVIVVNSDSDTDQIKVGERIGESEPTIREVEADLLDTMPFTIIPINSSNEQIKLAKTVNQNATWELDPYVRIDRGEEIGMTTDSRISKSETSNSHQFILNTDVERHIIKYSGNYIDTSDASDLKDLDIYTDVPKILIRQINSNIIAARDNEGYISTNAIYHVQCDEYLDYLCGYLPSKLVSFWYRHSFQSTEIKFPKVQMSHINALPVVLPHTNNQNEQITDRINNKSHPVDKLDHEAVKIADDADEWDKIRQEISTRVFDLVDTKEDENEIDLDLTNYIGFSERDTALGDIGVYVSQADEDSLLKNTANEYHDDSLRLGNVSVDKNGSTVTVSATVRYKPENPEEHELEEGYTESESFDAFQIVDISLDHADFIKEYVKYVVENHNDVRGFYMHATQNKTPLQRLRDDLKIPDYDEFENEWERYEAARDYAEDLDEEISELEDVIDSLVYILFGLTQEEIEIIEEDSDR